MEKYRLITLFMTKKVRKRKIMTSNVLGIKALAVVILTTVNVTMEPLTTICYHYRPTHYPPFVTLK